MAKRKRRPASSCATCSATGRPAPTTPPKKAAQADGRADRDDGEEAEDRREGEHRRQLEEQPGANWSGPVASLVSILRASASR